MPEPTPPVPAERAPEQERSLEVDRPIPNVPARGSDPLFRSSPMAPSAPVAPKRRSLLPRLRSRAAVVLFAGILLAVNLAAYGPAFLPGDPPVASVRLLDMASVAASLLRNPAHPLFSPDVFLGIPTAFTSAPILVLFFAALKGLLGISFGWAARILLALAACALSLGTYRFVRMLLKKEFPAFLAALLVGLPPYLLTFDPLVAKGFTHFGIVPWPALLGLSGENGLQHLLGFALVPFALASLLSAMRTPTYRRVLLAGLWGVAIAFASRLGLVAWFVGAVALLGTEIILGELGRKVRATVLAGLIGAGLAAVWYNPPFLAQTFAVGEGRAIFRGFVSLVPLLFAVVPVLATALFLVFDRKPRLQLLLLGILWFGFFDGIILAASVWGHALLPFPETFLGEAWFGLVLIVAWSVTVAVETLRRAFRFRLDERRANGLTTGLIVILLGAAVSLNLYAGGAARQYLAAGPDLSSSESAKVADALATHVQSGERVYVTGPTVQLLTLRTGVAQVSGVSAFGDVNPFRGIAADEIERGGNRARILAWLSAFGVSHVAVPAAPTDNPERDTWQIAHPELFIGEPFAVEDTIGTTTIVRAPGTLAVAVASTALHDLKQFTDPPTDEELTAYAQLRSSGTPLTVRTPSADRIEISGTLDPGQAVSLAVNAVPGWRLSGAQGRISRDPMGFVVVEPTATGPVNLALDYRPTAPWFVGAAVTLLTVLVLLLARTGRARKLAETYRKLPPPRGVLVAPSKGESFADRASAPVSARVAELHEQAKEHYRTVPDTDWVEQTDNFAGIEEFFHRNRELITKKLIDKYGEGDRYLDAGCGAGLLLRYLPPGSVGLDINPLNIAKAKEHAPKSALVVADIENIPFPSGMFTTVVCTEVLDRLPNPKQALAEIQRVLKPGGVIIGTVPRNNPMWRLRFLSSTLTPEPYRLEYNRHEADSLLKPFRVELLAPALSYMTWAFVARKEGGE